MQKVTVRKEEDGHSCTKCTRECIKEEKKQRRKEEEGEESNFLAVKELMLLIH